MILLKFALWTCAFYLGITALVWTCLFGGGHLMKGGFGIYWTRWGLVLPFGVIWFISYVLAYRFVLLNR
jgi:hypothetical protein